MSLSIDSPLAIWRNGFGRIIGLSRYSSQSGMALTFHSRGHSILVFPRGSSSESYTVSQYWRLPQASLQDGSSVYQSWCRYGPSVNPNQFQLLVLPEWETDSKKKIHKSIIGRPKAWFLLFLDWFTAVSLKLVLPMLIEILSRYLTWH